MGFGFWIAMPEGLKRNVPNSKTHRLSQSREIIPGGNLQPQPGLSSKKRKGQPRECDIVSQPASPDADADSRRAQHAPSRRQ